MAVKLAFNSLPAFFDANGDPLTGGLLYTYAAGSTSPQNTYQDSGANTAHANPIELDSRGEPPAAIWLTVGQTYKFVLKTSAGAPLWSVDAISGINDTTSSVDQWVPGPAPTYVSATSFTLVGDQTGTFHVGRRLKTTNTGGTVYSTVKSSVFGALTTVTVVNDSNSLDSGLSAVSYGLLATSNDAMARGVFPTMANFTSYIFGNTYSNNVADATNDIDIAAGGCTDSTGVDFMVGTALTKQLDAAWAVGSAAGGLDTGAIGNSDYYIWRIKRVDTQVVDVLYSLSATAPTMPANYTLKRLIGWFKRVGATIVAFHTYETEGGGLEMNWDAPTLDIALTNTLTTARRTDAVKVPLNFSVIANLSVIANDASANFVVNVCCPDQTDVAPALASGSGVNLVQQATNTDPAAQIQVRTSAAGLVASRSTLATVDTYNIWTTGFRWARRN